MYLQQIVAGLALRQRTPRPMPVLTGAMIRSAWARAHDRPATDLDERTFAALVAFLKAIDTECVDLDAQAPDGPAGAGPAE